jgi:hypothetical protein
MAAQRALPLIMVLCEINRPLATAVANAPTQTAGLLSQRFLDDLSSVPDGFLLSDTVLLLSPILVVNSWSCGEAEFQACQVAGSLPV